MEDDEIVATPSMIDNSAVVDVYVVWEFIVLFSVAFDVSWY